MRQYVLAQLTARRPYVARQNISNSMTHFSVEESSDWLLVYLAMLFQLHW
jgi:hypothetical protein